MPTNFIRILGAVAPILAITACASPATEPTLSAGQFTQPDPIAPIQAPNSYRINAGDKIKVTVFLAEDLSGEYLVEPSGTIGLPLVGSVPVSGMTTTELSDALEQLYGRRYLRDPDISIQMVEFTKSLITISGAVSVPGLFETIGPTNLVQAIARARGPSETANPRRVVVFRNIDGVRHAAAFDLKRIQSGLDANPPIYGGDEIVMDGSALKQALRDLLSITPLLGLYQIVR